MSLSGLGGHSLRGDPRDPRGVLAMERERRERDHENGIIGSGSSTLGHNAHHHQQHHQTVTRSFSMGFDEVRAQRENSHGIPQRQPRGPDSDRGAGFSQRRQHHGRGSGDLDVQSGVEIVVE